MKSETDVLKLLKEFLKSRLEIDTANITMDTQLESLGIDSLMQMELVFDFEDNFNFQMPDIDERPTTVGGLVKVICANLPEAGS